MSRYHLEEFLKAAERSFSLRKEIKNSANQKELILIAQKSGFHITDNDLAEDENLSRFKLWVKKSKISSIKNRY